MQPLNEAHDVAILAQAVIIDQLRKGGTEGILIRTGVGLRTVISGEQRHRIALRVIKLLKDLIEYFAAKHPRFLVIQQRSVRIDAQFTEPAAADP